MRAQRTIRLTSGSNFAAALTFVQQQPPDFIDRVVSALYFRVLTGDVERNVLLNLCQVGGPTKTFSVNIGRDAARLLDSLSETLTLGVGVLAAAAVVLAPTLYGRARLEAEYLSVNPHHDPTFLSDAFLRLWAKTQRSTATPLEVEFYTAIKTLSIQVSILSAECENLRRVVAEVTPMATKAPPTKDRLLSATAEELRKIATSWGLSLPKSGNLKASRNYLLRYFGFSSNVNLRPRTYGRKTKKELPDVND